LPLVGHGLKDNRPLKKNGFSTYLIRRLRVHGSADVLGGVKGSFPVNGFYALFECVRWWSKFLIDFSMIELALTGNKRAALSPPTSPAMGARYE